MIRYEYIHGEPLIKKKACIIEIPHFYMRSEFPKYNENANNNFLLTTAKPKANEKALTNYFSFKLNLLNI